MPRQSMETSRKADIKPHRAARKSPASSEVNVGESEDRLRMISEAAYYRALGRGFEGGNPVEDWLMAEAEIEGRLHRLEDSGSQLGCG